MQPPKTLTVCVDSRERIPLLFPKNIRWFGGRGEPPTLIPVTTRVTPLDSGDYCLDGFSDSCIIERKGSVRELLSNLFTADFKRATAAFERLVAATPNPILLLDFAMSDLFLTNPYVPEPLLVLDELLSTIREYRLHLLWPGLCKTIQSRTRLGELCVRLMLTYAVGSRSPRDHGSPDVQGLVNDVLGETNGPKE